MKVFGKGINDTENAKDYQTWHSMLRRCYSPVYKKDRPTYEGCEVCDEWLRLSTFKKWYAENIFSRNMYIRAEMAKLL